ncbi:hypothetical protein [Rhizosphaericola mali]|uniref:T9SS C-terminal target domain-containing protein n=1 Tax=Rhizosphaericola mali TaxID=2545455 RepID=A0A5P2G112_9BACT|nr:hypothetical protein [Rhizosphaericola mali]QES89496.1 hypothetical protein E0W69_012775 [Rhizosphaericola mali]
MKKYVLGLATVIALSTVACRKIESDGEPFIVEVPSGDGGGTTTGKIVRLTGNITSDTTLRAADNNTISGFVYVKSGATVTVEAGATVKGDYLANQASTLVIERGAKIIAVGTADAPIVFTSSNPNPVSGDWGGIALLGKASINANNGGASGQHLYFPEGGYSTAASGPYAGNGDAIAPTAVDDDNSGTMQYVRIEYAGNAYLPNQEINSLTLCAVGSGTTIDHIQVSFAKDDAFEWFGGTVNCKYLIAYKTQDDDFDTDNGYSGSVQFGLIIRDSSIADVSKSEGFESDNDASGTVNTPQTKAVFSNVSLFGPRATAANIGNSNYLGSAIQIRRNSSLSLYNSAIVGWTNGILIDASTGRATDLNIGTSAGNDSTLRIKGNVVFTNGFGSAMGYSANATPTGMTAAILNNWFTAIGNRVVTTAPEANFTRPFDYANPDWTPTGNSPLMTASGVNFTDALITSRAFIVPVTFAGGLSAGGEYATWHKGWTKFNY